MLDGDVPVSVCCAFGIGGGEANLGVTTIPSCVAGAGPDLLPRLRRDDLDRGLIPTWDCDAPNAASGELAHAIGFTEHAPFSELAFPNRDKPTQPPACGGQTRENGVTIWRRI